MSDYLEEDKASPKRPMFLQSFARRKSRAYSREQRKLIDGLYQELRIKEDLSNLGELTSGYEQICLEIGFGAGEHLLHQASKNPKKLYIGAEVFMNGVASCVQEMDASGIKNIRFFDQDSRILLSKLPERSLDIIYLLFADPWPKVRHNKRRIYKYETLSLFNQILKNDGFVRVATDHKDYWEWILEKSEEQNLFNFEVIEQPKDHIVTRYQQKGLDEGRPSQFLELIKK